jgi:hypothetical protein
MKKSKIYLLITKARKALSAATKEYMKDQDKPDAYIGSINAVIESLNTLTTDLASAGTTTEEKEEGSDKEEDSEKDESNDEEGEEESEEEE